MTFNQEFKIALKAADIGRKIAIKYWRSHLTVHSKSNPRDLVTQADIEVDCAIQKILCASNNPYPVLSEERAHDCNPQTTNALWVIDPIDGTVNFTMGEPLFGISIGLLVKGEPVLGVVDFPILEERYWAIKEGGAWMKWHNDKPKKCHVSRVSTLAKSRFSLGYAEDRTSQQLYAKLTNKFLFKTQAMRNNHSAVFDLMNVARGGMDFYICLGINVWDFAGSWCILNEAGGELHFPSHPLRVEKNNMIATNDKLSSSLLKLFP